MGNHLDDRYTESAVVPVSSSVLFKKKNELITSKSKMTLLGRKVLDIGIMKVEEGVNEQGMPEIHSVIYGTELKRILGRSGGGIYTQISDLIAPSNQKKGTKKRNSLKPSLLDWRIVYKDKESETIIASNVITTASFEKGVLKLVYNNDIRPYLLGYKNNYTMLDVNMIAQFDSTYSYQLYQLFRATMDHEKSITKQMGPFEMEVDLVELKCYLGIIDINEYEILSKAMTEGRLNYSVIEELKDEDLIKKLKVFGSFNEYALKPMREELNEKSDISVDYEPVRSGRGGKVVAVRFILSYKNVRDSKQTADRELSEMELMDLVDAVRDIINEKLSSRDILAILKAANNNLDKIKAAYTLSRQAGDIGNLTGWLIMAIKEGYKGSPKKSHKNFQQSGTNYSEIEDIIVESM